MDEKCLEVKYLKYVYTKDEQIELSKEMAYANRQLNELKDQKKSVMAQLNSQISAQEEMVNMLTTKVGNGYTYRDIECEIMFHQPEKGMKTILRTDIDETRNKDMDLTILEKMTEKDWMLWNDKYASLECEVEMHTPDAFRKTLIQRSTGHKFIEQMSSIEMEKFESESTIEYHKPHEGMKTLTHTSGKVIELKMLPADIDKTQGVIFNFEDTDKCELEAEEVNIEENEDEDFSL